MTENTPKLPPAPEPLTMPCPPESPDPTVQRLQDKASAPEVYAEVFSLIKMAAERYAAACSAADGRGDKLPSFESSGAAEVAAFTAKFAVDRTLG